MGISTVIITTKKIHPKDVILVKVGDFYHAYGRDSYILGYLFRYKLKQFEKDNYTCGFPTSSILKVMAKLEEKKINYLILVRRDNYEKDESADYGNLNNYDKTYEKAKKYINLKSRINKIYETLIEKIDNKEEKELKQVITQIEGILYEGREI